MLYALGLNKNDLEYIVDDSPLKQGKFSPGLHIPVVHPDKMYRPSSWPDYVLVLAWNFADPILKKHAGLREGGTHFIVPLPTLEITP